MKRIISYFTLLAVIAIFTVSCEPEQEKSFDQSLLTGKWKSGTLYYKYLADGTGATWDTADDVTEAEAQPYTWTLVKDQLTQIHIMQIGGSVPKVYTVTELTATTLKYHDDFDVSYSFTKVSK